jgi:hypothetical protein
MFGNFGDTAGDTPISSGSAMPLGHCERSTLPDALQAPRVAHADLRRALQQVRVLEARRVRAEVRRGARPSRGATSLPPR